MKTIELYLLLSLATIVSLKAQNTQDSLQAVSYRTAALEALEQGQKDSCAYYKEAALQLFRANNDLLNWINTHRTIGRSFRSADAPHEALSCFHAAEQEQLWRSPIKEEEWKELGWLYVNLGYTYGWTLAQDNTALPYYEKAKEILYQNLGFADPLVGQYVLRELGNIYSRLGDYSAAEIVLTKFKDISIAHQQFSTAAEAYSDLGLMHKNGENYEKAITAFEAGLKLPGLRPQSIGLLNVNLMKTYMTRDSFSLALRHAWKAKKNFEQSIRNEDHALSKLWLGSTIVEIGNIYTELGAFEKAETYLEEALEFFHPIDQSQQTREFGLLMGHFGNLYNKWQKYDLALDYHQRALKSVLPKFDYQSELDNPDPVHFYAETQIIEYLKDKASTLASRYEKTQAIADLEVALECHEQIFKAEQLLRRSYHYQSSKLFQLEESRAKSERSIAIALELWKRTGQHSYKEKAFEFAERSKSILLLQVFLKANATSIAGIPSALMQREKELQQDITLAEKNVFKAREKGMEIEKIKELENELFTVRKNYSNWIFELEDQYPQYYNLKYNYNTSSIAEIQQLIRKEDQAMIEYFVGDSSIYTFVITPDRFEILEQAKDFPLEEWVLSLKASIEQFQFSGVDRAALCAEYSQIAHNLYRKLIAPAEEVGLPTRLNIIPSGVMGLLPFDALLSRAPEQACHFESYPYLVYDYSISYGYSATLQVALTQRDGYGNSFAGFAPTFEGTGSFSPLLFNTETLKSIHAMIDGDVFLGTAATLENFKAVANKYSIIQFATHAKANTAAGAFSFIIFSDGQSGYDSLFVADLYVLDLAAEMVVLSACETAVGQMHKGEGMISLARGFLQSGAKSVLTTLWRINDESNKLLMQDFYAFLKQGYSKDESLQQAKIKQISMADPLYAHPVYWLLLHQWEKCGPSFPTQTS